MKYNRARLIDALKVKLADLEAHNAKLLKQHQDGLAAWKVAHIKRATAYINSFTVGASGYHATAPHVSNVAPRFCPVVTTQYTNAIKELELVDEPTVQLTTHSDILCLL